MDTASLALLISIASAIIAAVSLGWNIYRDVALKANVRVRLATGKIRRIESTSDSSDYVTISATNHGPGSVTLTAIILRNASLWKIIIRREDFLFLMYDYRNSYSGTLPTTLAVGEGVTLLFDYDKNCFLKESFSRLGIKDSFGRTHWAPRKNTRIFHKKWNTEFGSYPSSE